MKILLLKDDAFHRKGSPAWSSGRVGRTLAHAKAAQAYNSSGLFGIHWRTRALAPQFAALFEAGWSDGPADVASFYAKWCATEFGGGGSLASEATVPAATVAAACAPFLKLDAQVCSGNCADLQV